MKSKKILKETIIRTLKVLDIGYITVIYFILGIALAKLFDKLYGVFDKKEEAAKSFAQQSLELIGIMWVSGVVQGLMERAPSQDGYPLNTFFDFIAIRQPFYLIRILGGLMYLSGMFIMAYNVVRTMMAGTPVDAPIPELKHDVHL